jgi:hypothetical protein
MKPEKVICQNCVFWQKCEPDYGQCWRKPRARITEPNAWCGEWSDTWPASWIEYEEPPEPETVEVFQFMGGGSLPK